MRVSVLKAARVPMTSCFFASSDGNSKILLFFRALIVLAFARVTTAFLAMPLHPPAERSASSTDTTTLNAKAADEESDFYRELKKAKNEKMGAPIPPEQLKDSAKDAESEFLQAMKQSRKEFRDAKEELGSEGAIDLFLGKIEIEDKRREEEKRRFEEEMGQ